MNPHSGKKDMTSRHLLVLAVASLLAIPCAASAQHRGGASSGGVGLAGMIGFESGDTYDGVEFRFDADTTLTHLSPQVALNAVGTISYSHLSHSADSWDFIPALRVVFDVRPKLNLYGDLGLGINHISVPGDSATGATMRIGGGVQYALSPQWQLLGDAAFHPHWGDYDTTTFTFLGGVRYRM
jgi:opacity protein-like surface antigen